MRKNELILYLVKFVGMFCLLYFGTKAIIGLAVPGNQYSPLVDRFFDYPSTLRSSLLNGTRLLAGLFGFKTHLKDAYHVHVVGGRGIHLVYSCLGYGLLSFWITFIFANRGTLRRKLAWMAGGCFIIWLINVLRITFMLIAVNRNWQVAFSFDNHTVFNIVVYLVIFCMIALFMRQERRLQQKAL